MNRSNNIISIIPARAGSKGVPGKNIKKLNGKPLIAYSILSSLKSKLINRTIVSTDSKEIASIAKEYGAEVPFLRPKNIALDHSTDYELISNAIEWLKKEENYESDYIVHLRPTTPLREYCNIDCAIKIFLSNDEATALRSVHEMGESAYKYMEIKNSQLITIFSHNRNIENLNKSRQSFPKTYVPNGYVDVLRTEFIKKEKRIHGDNVISFISEEVTEVDEIKDFEYLEFQISKDKKLFNKIFK